MAFISERFPVTQTLGSTGNEILDRDVERLRLTGHPVDVVVENLSVGVVIRGYALPSGVYNRDTTDILLQTDMQYPASAMDMLWVDDGLLLSSGAIPAGGESREHHFGRDWRRLSWHRNAPWVAGRDDLVGHFEFAVARLARPQ
jgi:hypothetical protein